MKSAISRWCSKHSDTMATIIMWATGGIITAVITALMWASRVESSIAATNKDICYMMPRVEKIDPLAQKLDDTKESCDRLYELISKIDGSDNN